MTSTLAFNPYTTSQPQDSFLLQTQGLIQGLVYDDPASRLWLAGGVLGTADSIPMWGGVPIKELINVANSGSDGLGSTLNRSAAQADTTGFSVFNQAMSMVIGMGNTVPLAASGNYVSFFRLGTNVRLPVRCDPAIVTALNSVDGLINSQALYWDVTNYQITLVTTGGNWALPTSIKLLSVNTNSKIVSWSSPNATWAAGDAAIILI